MSEYTATISWQRGGARFVDDEYSRAHTWSFDGGVEVRASASPHIVPTPRSDPRAVDPEEAFVAALSSCHMLVFLSLVAKRDFIVESYRDEPVGTLARVARGKLAMTAVTLRPRVVFTGGAPSREEFEALHHEAHEHCFIANSVTTEVRCEPEMTTT